MTITTNGAGAATSERAAPETARAPQRPRARRRTLAIAAAAAAVLLLLGAVWWRIASRRESTDDAFVDGTISPISSRVAGVVTAVAVDDNQPVSAGDLLVRLDPRDYEVTVDQARAAVAVAEHQLTAAAEQVRYSEESTRAQLAQAQAGMEGAVAGELTARDTLEEAKAEVAAKQAALQTARSELDAAQATLEQSRVDYLRLDELVTQGIIARQQFDAATAKLRTDEAQVRAAQSRVAEAERDLAAAEAQRRTREAGYQSQLGVQSAAANTAGARAQLAAAEAALRERRIRTAQRDLAAAQVEQARAQLAQTRLDLSYTEIRAPISGRVTKKAVEVGQRVTPGQALLAIVPLDDVWITANFKETQLTRMRPRQLVDIEVDAYPGVTFHGKVDSIQAGTGSVFSLLPPENATGNYVKVVQRVPVKIVLDRGTDPRHVLRPGMSVVPTVRLR